MPSIVYDFIPGDTVYTVDATYGVRKAVVKNMTATVSPLTTNVQYGVQFSNAASGSTLIQADDLFDDVDAALAAYRDLIG